MKRLSRIAPLLLLMISALIITPLIGASDHFANIRREESARPEQYEGKTIKEIKTLGNNNRSRDQIVRLFGMREGDTLSLQRVDAALTSLLKTGTFANAAVDATLSENEVILTIIVDELPEVSRISIFGDETKQTELLELITNHLRVGQIFSEKRLSDAKEMILAKYRDDGYLMASVRDDVRINEQTKLVEVEFTVDQGREVRVKAIAFRGNTVFKDSEIKRQMETKEDALFAGGGKFNETKFETDKLKIEQYYKTHGYYNARVMDAVIEYRWRNPETKKEKDMYIDIVVHEGEQYRFGTIEITNNLLLSSESVFADFRSKRGAVYNATYAEADVNLLRSKYFDRGYIFSHVRDIVSVDEEKKTINILYIIYEGDKAHIENISVAGNTKTQSNVILRYITLREGELFNAQKIRESQEAIFRTQFFEDARPDMKPGSTEGLMNLIFNVKEAQTGMISAGLGYGTVSKFSVFAELRDINFFGKGQTYNFRGEWGENTKSLSFTFTEPYLFGTPFYSSSSISIGNYRDVSEEPYYEQAVASVSETIGYYFSDVWTVYWRNTFQWYYYYQTINDYASSPHSTLGLTNYSPFDGWYTQTNFTWTTMASVVHDSRNNTVDPSRGARGEASVAFYTGSSMLTKAIVGGSFAKRLPLGFILVGFAEYGTSFGNPLGLLGESKQSIVNENDYLFTMNYYEDVRGWRNDPYIEFQSNRGLPTLFVVGTNSDHSYSSNYYVLGRDRLKATLELRYTVIPNILGLAAFFDMGRTWFRPSGDTTPTLHLGRARNPSSIPWLNNAPDILRFDNYVYSTGVGLRVMMPIFPIRVYLAKRFTIPEGNFTSDTDESYLFGADWLSFLGPGWEVVISMSQTF